MKRTRSEVSERLKKKAKGRAPVAENRPLILAALARGETFRSAARRGGIGETALRDRLAGDEAFAAEVEAARAEGRERRADAIEQALFEGAEQVGEDPRYTGAAIFALTNLAPDRWRNTQHQRVEVQEEVEHDLGDNLIAVLESIAGGPPAPDAEVGKALGAPAKQLAGPGGGG